MAKRTCEHPDGCDRPHKARGLCSPHYSEWWKANPSMPKSVHRPTPPPIFVDGDIAYVELTQGKVATIDAADVAVVAGFTWSSRAPKRGSAWYAQTPIRQDDGRRSMVEMQRVIMGCVPGDGLEVDHIDRDGLNNRRSNLRVGDHLQNLTNRGPWLKGTSSFKGVSASGKTKPWAAQITVDGYHSFLGYFDVEEDAARAYDAAALGAWGDCAYLNFPNA